MREGETELRAAIAHERSRYTRRQWLVWSAALAGAACRGSATESNASVPANAAAPDPKPAAAGSANTPIPPTQASAGVNTKALEAPAASNAEPIAGDGTPPLAIALQPLGEQLPEAHVALVKAALQTFYRCDVAVQPRVALPQAAYTQARRRYRAERLLDTLLESRPAGASRILGLTAVDISTTKGSVADWGILGLATIDGSACVISSFRTSRGAKDDTHAAERLAKTAVHEIGHTLGLEHCPNRGCLMEDGKGTVFTTDGEYELCTECRARLERAGVPLTPLGTQPPWPRPQ